VSVSGVRSNEQPPAPVRLNEGQYKYHGSWLGIVGRWALAFGIATNPSTATCTGVPVATATAGDIAAIRAIVNCFHDLILLPAVIDMSARVRASTGG